MLPHLAGSATSRQRFMREAQAAAALEHDHIVPILHVGEERGAPYIVMPFLKGESLFSFSGSSRNAVANIDASELARFPVEMISWNDCQEFVMRLNEVEKAKG